VAMREHHIPDGRVVVCGMDADLTLMAMTELQSPLRPYAGMYILREQESASTEASIINVDTLLRGVVNNLMQSTDTSVVCDFVALVALAGNDFVPALPGIVIHRGGIDHLVRLYHEERQGGGTERLWGSEGGAAYLGGLNLAFLRRILQRAARTEGIALSKQDSLQRYEIRPLEPAWRARYYVAEFGSFESEFVLRISRQYVAMVAWSAVYLILKQCLSIGAICTNGHAAPLALDVANSIDDKIDEYCRKFYKTSEALAEASQKHMATLEQWHQAQILPSDTSDEVMSPMFPTSFKDPQRIPIVDLTFFQMNVKTLRR